jgi:hypothetical protein
MACGPINMHTSWVMEKDFYVCFASRRSNDVYVPNQNEKKKAYMRTQKQLGGPGMPRGQQVNSRNAEDSKHDTD